jgi:hypothetical protein
MKTAARKVMRAGRATVFPVGGAMISALAVGLASCAPAGVGVGARFDVGP